jgi:methionine sulfoxide reductase heme-binding subunit
VSSRHSRLAGALPPLVFGLSLLPLARLVWLGAGEGLGANPVEFVTRSTGTWSLAFLCLALAVSPLRRLTGWAAPLRLRRMIGLFAFFYSALHLSVFLWLEHWFDLWAMVLDGVARPFLAAGFAAFVLMVPLAATSTQAMVRRLGPRWKSLHRFVYLAAVLAIVHFWWHKAGKNDLFEPVVYAAIVALLLAFRLEAVLRPIAAGWRKSGEGAGPTRR